MSNANTRITRPDSVDAACRLPVLALGLGALGWLLVGLLLSLGASVALHEPGLGACPYLGPGKLAAAARVALTYGFALPGALGLGIWVLFRGIQAPIVSGGVIALGSFIWNFGVKAGVLGIIVGEMSGFPGFDFPSYAGGIFLTAYGLIGLGVLTGFGISPRRQLGLPQLMVLAALLWIPWLMATAQVLLVWYPVRGVLSSVVAGWYSSALFWGCLVPMALAILLQIRREISGVAPSRQDYGYLGFWSLLGIAGWLGASSLIGGPVPAWIASVGVVAGVLLVLPVLLLGLHLFSGRASQSGGHPALRLGGWSGMAFIVGGLATSATSLRCAHRILGFTQFQSGLNEALFLGVVTLALLAGFYLVLPRLIGFAWDRPLLTGAHVGLCGLGLFLVLTGSLLGGWWQGSQLNQAGVDMEQVNAGLLKYLRLHSFGLLIFLAAQGVFALQVALLGAKHLPALKQFVMGLLQVDRPESKALVEVAK